MVKSCTVYLLCKESVPANVTRKQAPPLQSRDGEFSGAQLLSIRKSKAVSSRGMKFIRWDMLLFVCNVAPPADQGLYDNVQHVTCNGAKDTVQSVW